MKSWMDIFCGCSFVASDSSLFSTRNPPFVSLISARLYSPVVNDIAIIFLTINKCHFASFVWRVCWLFFVFGLLLWYYQSSLCFLLVQFSPIHRKTLKKARWLSNRVLVILISTWQGWMASIDPKCTELKLKYDTCFNSWFVLIQFFLL